MMQSKLVEKYFFLGLLFATLLLTFFIFRPFWIVLILAICFAVIIYPIYEYFKRHSFPNWLASLVTMAIFVIVVCGPILGIGTIVFNQSQNAYSKLISDGNLQPLLIKVDAKVNNLLPSGVTFNSNEKLRQFVSYLSNNISDIFTTTVSAFFSFVLMLLIMFYLLKEGAELKHTIIVLSPLGEENDEKIIQRLNQAINGVIKGSLFIAVVQGTLMGLGLWFFGISNPALWGVVAAITSLVPTFGTSLVSIPSIIFLFATGQTVAAVGLLLWSMLMVGTIDNFLGPLIVGRRANISSILILFSVLGGIALFGPVGIFIGPLTISLLYALVSIYRNEFN